MYSILAFVSITTIHTFFCCQAGMKPTFHMYIHAYHYAHTDPRNYKQKRKKKKVASDK